MLAVAKKPQGTIILVDARGFKATRGQPPPARHRIGTCYENLHDLVRHRDFAKVWPRLMWRLSDALHNTDHAHPVAVAFYCKSGKHRSVGLAWALTKILRERYWDVGLRHTMREYWHLGSCRERGACARDTNDKPALLESFRPQIGLPVAAGS